MKPAKTEMSMYKDSGLSYSRKYLAKSKSGRMASVQEDPQDVYNTKLYNEKTDAAHYR